MHRTRKAKVCLDIDRPSHGRTLGLEREQFIAGLPGGCVVCARLGTDHCRGRSGRWQVKSTKADRQWGWKSGILVRECERTSDGYGPALSISARKLSWHFLSVDSRSLNSGSATRDA